MRFPCARQHFIMQRLVATFTFTCLLLLMSTTASPQRTTRIRIRLTNSVYNVNAAPEAPATNIVTDYGQALDAIFGLAIRTQVLLQDPAAAQTENFVISPLSVTQLVSQLLLGARDGVSKSLYQMLTLPVKGRGLTSDISSAIPYATFHAQLSALIDKLSHKSNSSAESTLLQLKNANALFYDKSVVLRTNYTAGLQRFYDTQTTPLDFAQPADVLSVVNKWADVNTNGLIKTILPTSPPASTKAIFANALYFKAFWETPFSAELTNTGTWHRSATETSQVTYMMNQFESVLYAEDAKLGCKLVGLPYMDREYVMYMVLPNKGSVDEFNIRNYVKDMKPEDLKSLLDRAEDAEVTVKIPKLHLSSSINILDTIQKFDRFKRWKASEQAREQAGARSRWGGPRNSDRTVLETLDNLMDEYEQFIGSQTDWRDEKGLVLDNAASHMSLPVAAILQQVTMSVDENGTEAAAITASTIDYKSSKTFLANKPFFFIIRHHETAAAIFWGAIVDPSKN